MKVLNLAEELKGNSYPGRGIVIGKLQMEKELLQHILLWVEVQTAETGFL